MSTIDLPGAGEILGPYRLQRPLASGEGGGVFIAEHGVLKRQVVLKVAPATLPTTFFAEARAARASAHPHVVQVVDIVDKGNKKYVSFELLRGRSLADVVKEGLSLPRAVHIARQIAAALEAVHAASIVHRDVKPANVFLVDVRSGHDGDADFVKLLDIAADGSEGKKVPPGAVVGSPLYMAPELLKQQGGDHRTDIYAFGVLLCELLTGRRPFEGSTNDVVKDHLLTPPPKASSLAPERGIPEPLDLLVQECLAKAVEARPASMQEVGLALGAMAELVGVHRPKPGGGDLPDTIAMPRPEGGWKPFSLSEGSSSQAQRRPATASAEASTSGLRAKPEASSSGSRPRRTAATAPEPNKPPPPRKVPVHEQPTVITEPPSLTASAPPRLDECVTPADGSPALILRADTPPAAPPPGADQLFDDAPPAREHADTSPTNEFAPVAESTSPMPPSIDLASLPDIPPPLASSRRPWIGIAAIAAVVAVIGVVALVAMRRLASPSVIPTAVAADVPPPPKAPPQLPSQPEDTPPPNQAIEPEPKPVATPPKDDAPIDEARKGATPLTATAKPEAAAAETGKVADKTDKNEKGEMAGKTEQQQKKKKKKSEDAKKEGDLLNPFGD